MVVCSSSEAGGVVGTVGTERRGDQSRNMLSKPGRGGGAEKREKGIRVRGEA